MGLTGESYVACATALEACEMSLEDASKMIKGEDLDEMITLDIELLATKLGRTPLETQSGLISFSFLSHFSRLFLLALKICNGDKNQAEILLESDPLELGAFNAMNEMQQEAIQFLIYFFILIDFIGLVVGWEGMWPNRARNNQRKRWQVCQRGFREWGIPKIKLTRL